jgi:hypothetical protein
VRLAIDGRLTLDGAILANGAAVINSSGGAGGSIWISAREIVGAGTLHANGADQQTTNGSSGGGGGGRIALDACTIDPDLVFSVAGGAGAGSGQSGEPGTVSTTIRTVPTVQADPQNILTCPSDVAAFSVSADGSGPLAYRWQWMIPKVTDWADVIDGSNADGEGQALFTAEGAASASVSVQRLPGTPHSLADFALRVIVANTCDSATSAPATWTVRIVPSIQADPEHVSVCLSGIAAFSVSADGSEPLAYRWQWLIPDVTDWTDVVDGANTDGKGQALFTAEGAATAGVAVQRLPDTPHSLADFALRAIVTNVCDSATSAPATWTVMSAPSVQAEPQDVSICPSGVAVFSVTANGSEPRAYQWQWMIPEVTDWTDVVDGSNTDAKGQALFTAASAATAGVSVQRLPGTSHSLADFALRVTVANACDSATSAPAAWRICRADFNCDAANNSQDFFDYLGAFFDGTPAADFNADTFIDSQDFFDFLIVFFAGC